MEMGVIIIGSIILILICTIIAIYDNNKNAKFDVGIFLGIILSILMIVEVVLLSEILENPRPTAMDVYQGKTTLEYTIRDSVKIDSIVVFKDSLIIN
jgi:hypothetical protein